MPSSCRQGDGRRGVGNGEVHAVEDNYRAVGQASEFADDHPGGRDDRENVARNWRVYTRQDEIDTGEVDRAGNLELVVLGIDRRAVDGDSKVRCE